MPKDPAWVVLDRSVRLVASTGERASGGAGTSEFDIETCEEIELKRRRMEAEEAGVVVIDDAIEKEEPMVGVVEWVRAGSVRFVPELAEAPKISSISLHLPATPREIRAQTQGVNVACADKNLLVLFTGPDALSHASSGRYLVYDADADTFFVPPRIDFRQFREVLGYIPAIVRQGEAGNFVLAVVVQSRLSWQYSVLVWSGSSGQDQWAEKKVNFPSEVLRYSMTDLSFAFQESWVCWVDLYFGIVSFNVLSDRLELWRLPEPYMEEWPPSPRMSPAVHRTMGCVNGVIKFLSMDGYDNDYDDCPKDRINITSWTLISMNSWTLGDKWMKVDGHDLPIAKLWADRKFRAIPGLKQQVPMCPVLSLKEPNMVSFFFSDIGYVDGHIATKGEYVLSLDMQSKKKIQSLSRCPPRGSLELIPRVMATDFCAHQQRSCIDDQGNVTSSSSLGAPCKKWAIVSNVFRKKKK